MLGEMPDSLRTRVLEYLEHKDFIAAKLIYDEWHGAKQEQTILSYTSQTPPVLRNYYAGQP